MNYWTNNLTLFKKINMNIDDFYINPVKYKYKNNNNNNNNINNLNDLDDLNSIINTLTSIIMNNSNKNNTKNNKNDIKNDSTNNEFNPILFKLVANNNINQLENIIKFNENINVNEQDKDGDTPLHIAIFLCNINAMEILMNNGANPSLKDKWGQTPIHRLCFCIGDTKIINIITFFIEYNKKNKLDIFNDLDNFGNSPLHLVLKHIIKNNTILNQDHLKLITKLKTITNKKIKNVDGYNINDLIKIINK